MSEKLFLATGLDLGSKYTRAVICSLVDSRMHFLGCGLTESSGWAKSRMVERRGVSANVLASVQQAEEMARLIVESVTVGCGGLTVRGTHTSSRLETGRPREIEQRHINQAMGKFLRMPMAEDRMMLQMYPQDFSIDGQPGFRDPRHMLASSLEAHAYVMTVSRQEHENLVGSINHAHLAVEESVYEAIAACHASVLPEERREGLAFLDIGGQSTEMAVYYGDALQLTVTIPISGDHFTRDIAHVLHVNFEEAERLKEEFGCANSSRVSATGLVDLESSRKGEWREAPRQQLAAIIEARAEELFRYAQKELTRAGMDRSLASGLVLSGGGAMLDGICDVAERILDCPARVGRPLGIEGWPEALDDPSWTTAAGLAMYSARLRTQVDLERQSVGFLGRILR